MKKLLYILALASLASCAMAPQPVQYTIKGNFDESELEWFKEEGSSTIYGNSFINDNLAIQRGLQLCAGYEVNLMPVNSYYGEVLNLFFDNLEESYWDRSSTFYKYETDPASDGYGRTTKCDSAGNFQFDNLPKGSYWIITGISYEGGPFRTLPPTMKGGWLLKKVTVDGANDKKVVLSR